MSEGSRHERISVHVLKEEAPGLITSLMDGTWAATQIVYDHDSRRLVLDLDQIETRDEKTARIGGALADRLKERHADCDGVLGEVRVHRAILDRFAWIISRLAWGEGPDTRKWQREINDFLDRLSEEGR